MKIDQAGIDLIKQWEGLENDALAARFLSYVDRSSDCWLWLGCRNAAGYGRISIGRKATGRKAHRVAWELFRGEIPEGAYVLHSCDNPACVNPKHLFLGTQNDNLKDMRDKGRGSAPPVHLGEAHHNVKFSKEVALGIIKSSGSLRELANQYGVSTKTIWRLKNGKTWKELST